MNSDPVPLAEPGGRPQGLLCPVCRVDLVMSDRLGIEIDYCPKCRGIWLDRGELDKIIERTEAEYRRQAPVQQPQPAQPGYRDDPYAGHGSGYGGSHGHGSSRRHGFFGRLFD